MARITMKKTDEMTVEQAFSLFFRAASARGVTDKTLQTYKHHSRALFKRCDGSVPLGELTRHDLEDWINTLREGELSEQSIKSYTRTLKVFFSWCNAEGYTTLNIPIYRTKETVKETYTDEELMRLLQKPDAASGFCAYRNWVIINFLLDGGCRAATVRNIQNQDVDLERRQIILRHTKNGRPQVIPLCNAMVGILKTYMAVRGGGMSDYLFCNEFGDFLTESGLRQAIAKYNRAHGVERTSIHAFRHTFARKFLIDCGGDAFTLQKTMGHSTLAMTRHYCNIFNDDMVEKHEQFSPLAQLSKTQKRTIKM